ncbi:UDP-N-acetylglucosamine 2-epimerase [Vibrio chagasii]|nr:UDP-N-acetylglucosamine 2-epimerase [Vibrio chagasii]
MIYRRLYRESFGGGVWAYLWKVVVSMHAQIPKFSPIYRNRVREPVNRILAGIDNIILSNHSIIYHLYLMSRAHIILTDSGGIQEEAFIR